MQKPRAISEREESDLEKEMKGEHSSSSDSGEEDSGEEEEEEKAVSEQL